MLIFCKSLNKSKVLSNSGTALTELAISLPLLVLTISVMVHLSFLMLNIGHAIDAVFDGALYAPRSSSLTEIQDRVENTMKGKCKSCNNISATAASDGTVVTVKLTTDFELKFFPVVGVLKIPFSFTQFGYINY